MKSWVIPVVKQLMANLPRERLIPYDPPFTYTGVDFFGTSYVKRGRGTDKVYGCLFTGFTSRAVHIEDVCSLVTDVIIQALRRLMSNRRTAYNPHNPGLPKKYGRLTTPLNIKGSK